MLSPPPCDEYRFRSQETRTDTDCSNRMVIRRSNFYNNELNPFWGRRCGNDCSLRVESGIFRDTTQDICLNPQNRKGKFFLETVCFRTNIHQTRLVYDLETGCYPEVLTSSFVIERAQNGAECPTNLPTASVSKTPTSTMRKTSTPTQSTPPLQLSTKHPLELSTKHSVERSGCIDASPFGRDKSVISISEVKSIQLRISIQD
jgi:hypothetical protein